MRKTIAFTLFAFAVLSTTIIHAQTRTWVSGTGDDGNACSFTLPCKTFAGAFSKTAAGGEIDALGPGSYGTLTITKAITIDGGAGNVAGVLAGAGGNGFTVSAGASDVVILRNLTINGGVGTSSVGFSGIAYTSGKALVVEHCSIFGFGFAGIQAQPSAGGAVTVKDTNLANFPGGGFLPGVGIMVSSSSGVTQVGVERVRVDDATYGIFASTHSRVTVNNSYFQHMSVDGIHAEDTSTDDSQISVDRANSSYNGNGITANTGSTILVSDSTTAFNTSCNLNNTGGNLYTFQNNREIGTPNCGTISPAFLK
ncbi:MAG TPA: hypothetical protein VJA94_19060 [Candidatus Angelobacter sp.]